MSNVNEVAANTPAATAIDVAAYIKAKTRVFGEMHLLKLVYYAQAWSLAWDGKPLFGDEIQAWKGGPVVRRLYRMSISADANALAPEQACTVDAVLAYYAPMSGKALSDRTHEETPWVDAWERRAELDWGKVVISHDVMRRYYAQQAQEGIGPTQTADYEEADSLDLLAIARRNAKRWQGTLELLAR